MAAQNLDSATEDVVQITCVVIDEGADLEMIEDADGDAAESEPGASALLHGDEARNPRAQRESYLRKGEELIHSLL